MINKKLYSTNSENSARFILGSRGEKPLIVFGLNPSTAEPEKPDPTVRRILGFAESWGYDSVIIFNLYPQRATDPEDLHQQMDRELHRKHLKHIEDILSDTPAPLWAAWGNLIESRGYLQDCLRDIQALAENYGRKWYRAGTLTKKGHPRHPLYLKKETVLEGL